MQKARRASLAIVGVDYNKRPAGREYCDHYYQVSYKDEEAIFRIAQKHRVAGIATIGTNDAIWVAARLSHRLNLPGLYDPPNIIRRATYKNLWRKTFEQHGVPVPKGTVCEDLKAAEVAALEIGFPALLKPTDASGSKGTTIIDKMDELPQAFQEAMCHSTTKAVLVESYIGYNSFAVESFVIDGKAYLVAIGERKLPSPPICVGLGVTTPDNLSTTAREAIEAINTTAIEALEITYGPVHIDMVLDSNDRPFVIDVGPRLVAGPFGWEHIFRTTGFDIVEAVLRQAIGEKLDTVRTHSTDRYYAHRYLTTSQTGVVKRVDANRDLFNAHNITSCKFLVNEGDFVNALKHSNHRYGYVTAWGKSFESVCEKIDSFVDKVSFEIDSISTK
jgi:biotin carboxylase